MPVRRPALPPRAGPAAAVALALALGVHAGTVRADCHVSLDGVAFGVVDLERASAGTGRIVVDCDRAATFEVGIASRAGGPRRMRGPGGSDLVYELYQDAARKIRWGDGDGNGSARAGSAEAGKKTTLTIYGVIPRQGGVRPGEYADSVQVTLLF